MTLPQELPQGLSHLSHLSQELSGAPRRSPRIFPRSPPPGAHHYTGNFLGQLVPRNPNFKQNVSVWKLFNTTPVNALDGLPPTVHV